MAEITIPLAFIAGVFSFLSPCVLPLIPAFLTFLASQTISQTNIKQTPDRKAIFLSAVFFVLGFSIVFSVLGVLLQSVLASAAYDIKNWLGYIGGAIIIIFGLTIIGILKLDFLAVEHKINVKKGNSAWFSSLLFGAAFAVGWTPCVGAILGSILTLAVTQPQAAFPIMLVYSLGLGLPFLLVGLFTSQAADWIKSHHRLIHWLNIIFGIVLVLLGILVFTGTLSAVANLEIVNEMLLK